ncbi:MAG: hypothetical protein BMS9Abin37_2688 [Acidobacteriota bacterium]|nr:MAG: hypothetical protein BMS9Abin37_2688 [Acidobacteriota bacterium]
MSRIIFALLLVSATQSEPVRDTHQKWLEEDVRYIITERERELFLSLETRDERARFITAFWAKRDPNRTTPENEFRDEHYRRIDYTNEFLGRESFLPGWRTDRGRYYIILGEPRAIQRFYGNNALKEAELWFFQGQEGRGLPAFFYLLFFKRDEVGDFRLYHPLLDGPASLLRGTDISAATDNLVAVARLEEIDSELAQASLSLDAGEPPDFLTGRAAIGVDALLARIEDSPKRAINTDYIDAWTEYGKRVSAEYSFNFVPSRHLFAVMEGPEETPIVHYSIELDPTSFGLETDEHQSKFYTTLDVTVEATHSDGTLVHSTARSTFIELTAHQVAEIQTAPVAYQDDFPLVPGSYTISVIARNRALKNYTVAEADLEIPEYVPTKPAIVDVILCHDATVSAEGVENEVRTFQLGGVRLEPATGNIFAIGDTVTVFAQAHAAPDGPDGTRTQFDLVSGDDVLDSDTGAPTGELSTLGLVSGDYQVRVQLVGTNGAVVAEKRVGLTLSPRTHVPRPAFVYRRGFNTKAPGLLALVRGDQLWRLSRFEDAQEAFEAAVAAGNPNLPQAHWKLATAYLRTGEAERAMTLLAPLEEHFPDQFEVVAGLGLGFYLEGNYEKTVGYLERATRIRSPDTSILNALGDSHQRLGDEEKARHYFERSLELDPTQDAVSKRLARMETSR